MQKNKKAKPSTLKKIAPLAIAGVIIGTGFYLVDYIPQIDYNQDGVYSGLECALTGAIVGATVTIPTAVGVSRYYSNMNQKNKADSYGHVKSV